MPRASQWQEFQRERMAGAKVLRHPWLSRNSKEPIWLEPKKPKREGEWGNRGADWDGKGVLWEAVMEAIRDRAHWALEVINYSWFGPKQVGHPSKVILFKYYAKCKGKQWDVLIKGGTGPLQLQSLLSGGTLAGRGAGERKTVDRILQSSRRGWWWATDLGCRGGGKKGGNLGYSLEKRGTWWNQGRATGSWLNAQQMLGHLQKWRKWINTRFGGESKLVHIP